MAERAGASPDAGVHVPLLAIASRLPWAMGKFVAAPAGRDSQPIPMEAALCIAGRVPVLSNLAQHPFLGKPSQETPLPWPQGPRFQDPSWVEEPPTGIRH